MVKWNGEWNYNGNVGQNSVSDNITFPQCEFLFYLSFATLCFPPPPLQIFPNSFPSHQKTMVILGESLHIVSKAILIVGEGG